MLSFSVACYLQKSSQNSIFCTFLCLSSLFRSIASVLVACGGHLPLVFSLAISRREVFVAVFLLILTLSSFSGKFLFFAVFSILLHDLCLLFA